MKFLNALWNNKVKIIGVILAVHTQLMVELSVWATDGLVSPITVRIIGTIGTIFAVAVSAAGFMNTTAERVAESKATEAVAKADIAVAEADVAKSMKAAIEATPGEKV